MLLVALAACAHPSRKFEPPTCTGVDANELCFAWPVEGVVTSHFGSARPGRQHGGIDIVAETGTEVRAAAPGQVRFSGWMRGYGRIVVIAHKGGYETAYAHHSKNRVKPGDWVDRWEVIGEVGDSGNARGPHLHFEIRKRGRAVDPVALLGDSQYVARR